MTAADLLRPEPPPERPKVTARHIIDAALALEGDMHLNVGPSDSCTLVARQAVQQENRRVGRKVLRSYTVDGRVWVAKVDES